MARSFLQASSQHIRRDQTPISSYPLSMACWFHSNNADSWQTLMSLANSASGANYINVEIRGDDVDQLRIIVRDETGYKYADTTAAYSANTWHHACAICASSIDRRVFIDGGSKGTSTETKAFPFGINRMGIGALVRKTVGAYMDGYIAEAGLWDAALTDAEVVVLAKGYCPLFVRAQNLTGYWRLFSPDVSMNPEIMRGFYLTDYNSPGIAAHPRIIYPRPPFIQTPVTGVSPLLLRAIEKY